MQHLCSSLVLGSSLVFVVDPGLFQPLVGGFAWLP